MARTPAAAARERGPSRATTALANDLLAALRARTRGGRWGVLVTSVSRGDMLFAEEPDRLLKPASTLKLMTTALALETFGVDHTFTTEVLLDRPAQGGLVDGNLYLRGGGDPTLSLRF